MCEIRSVVQYYEHTFALPFFGVRGLTFSSPVAPAGSSRFANIMNAKGFPGGSDGKESVCNEGDLGSMPGSGRSPGEGNGSPLQYSYLENSMDRETWWAI